MVLLVNNIWHKIWDRLLGITTRKRLQSFKQTFSMKWEVIIALISVLSSMVLSIIRVFKFIGFVNLAPGTLVCRITQLLIKLSLDITSWIIGILCDCLIFFSKTGINLNLSRKHLAFARYFRTKAYQDANSSISF